MLFDKMPLGSLTLSNRLFRSASSEGAADTDGCPNEVLKNMYIDLARGGTGLIITGFAYIRSDGRSGTDQNGIHREELIPVWKGITDAVHTTNPQACIAMQIVHGGRQCKADSVKETLAPSAVYDPRAGILPREMTTDETWEMVEAFGQAARRVKAAGFDALQLHAAHGYLISQFNSPHTNRRADEWGGSLEKRSRFFIEVFRRCRKEVGAEFPIFAKMNCTDFLPTGISPEEAGQIGRLLVDEGLQGIEISSWMYEAELALSPSRKYHPQPAEEGYFLNEARIMRAEIPASVPVGLCGGVRSVAVMEQLLKKGFDFIAMARPFIAEPDLAHRLAKGQSSVACDSCNECIEGSKLPIVKCPPVLEKRLYDRIGHPEWRDR